jgi:hypothetical protein
MRPILPRQGIRVTKRPSAKETVQQDIVFNLPRG